MMSQNVYFVYVNIVYVTKPYMSTGLGLILVIIGMSK